MYTLGVIGRFYFIYILINKSNKVLYTGVTSNLKKRIQEHKQKLVKGFTSKYNIDRLVYFEVFDDIKLAIQREKQIKAGSRIKKIILVETNNPEYRDLYNEL